MSANEEAVTKQPKRRKAKIKRKAKKRNDASAQLRTPKDNKPLAETPIIISGGNINGKITIFTDAPLERLGNENVYVMEGVLGRVEVIGGANDVDEEIDNESTVKLHTE